MKSEHKVEQEISADGILKSAIATEKHIFKPFSRQGAGAVTQSRQSLVYTREGTPRTATSK